MEACDRGGRKGQQQQRKKKKKASQTRGAKEEERRASSQRSLTVPPRSPSSKDRSHLRAKFSISQFRSRYHLGHSNEARYIAFARDENRERGRNSRSARYTASRQRRDCRRRRRSPAPAPRAHASGRTRACARSHLYVNGDVGEDLEALRLKCHRIPNLFPSSIFRYDSRNTTCIHAIV